jgi:hypothetical protein
MPDAIGPSHNLPPRIPPSPDVPALAKKLQDDITHFAGLLEQNLEDPSLSEQSSFLQSMKEALSSLRQIVEKALTLR